MDIIIYLDNCNNYLVNNALMLWTLHEAAYLNEGSLSTLLGVIVNELYQVREQATMMYLKDGRRW